jgi:hypothetical protein
VISKILLSLYLAAFMPSPLSLAQLTKPCVKTKAGKTSVTQECLQPWELERKARFARAFQYQLGLQEQPGTATIQNGSAVQFIPNPEHYLVKHSLTFQFSELFLTSSDFASALKTFSDTHSGKGLDLRYLCGDKSALNCVASSGSWWRRSISGVKVVFSLSERTRVISGIVVPAGPFPSDYDKAGEIDFDPTPIFITGSSWKTAAAALAGIPGVKRGDNKLPQCFLSAAQGVYPLNSDYPAECIKRYGGSKSGWVGFLAVALPNFKYLRQTQFDFLKNGGALIPAPFPESGLNSYTFIWDLKRLIAPAKERVAAAEALTTYNKKPKPALGAADPSPQPGTKLCVTIWNGQKSYMQISDSFPESSCERFAGTMSDGHFRFACVATNGEVTFGDEAGHRPVRDTCGWADETTDLVHVANANDPQ